MTIKQSGLPIAATGLRKSFGDHVMFDGLDMNVPRATAFSLLGANGAGVGNVPVEFVETFRQNDTKGGWVCGERDRLVNAIERAAGEATGREEGAV